MKQFIDWLHEQLRTQKIKSADLARDSGLSPSTISRLLSGQTKPTDDVLSKIAEALGEPPEKILRLAGRLPRIPEDNSIEQDMLYNFRLLSKTQQQFFIDALRGLLGEPARPQASEYREQELPYEDMPSDEHIMVVFKYLNSRRQRQVYDFARWQLKEQYNLVNSSGDRRQDKETKRREYQEVIDLIDLMLAIEEATPKERENFIFYLMERVKIQPNNNSEESVDETSTVAGR